MNILRSYLNWWHNWQLKNRRRSHTSKGSHLMGDGRIFLKSRCDAYFIKDLSNEPKLGQSRRCHKCSKWSIQLRGYFTRAFFRSLLLNCLLVCLFLVNSDDCTCLSTLINEPSRHCCFRQNLAVITDSPGVRAKIRYVLWGGSKPEVSLNRRGTRLTIDIPHVIKYPSFRRYCGC